MHRLLAGFVMFRYSDTLNLFDIVSQLSSMCFAKRCLRGSIFLQSHVGSSLKGAAILADQISGKHCPDNYSK